MAKKSTGRAYSKAQVEKQRRARGNAIRRAIFVVAVLAVVVLAVVFLVLRGGEGASVGENAIGSAFSPLQNAFSSATKWVRDLFQGWRNYDELEANYQELFLENQQLSLELQSAEEAVAENQRLLSLLDAQSRYEELDPLYARVIARDPGQWFDTFSVNRGTNDGVSVGMAVVTGDGLVGRVYEAGLNYAKVLTIIDSRSAVSCLIERTHDIQLVIGLRTGNGYIFHIDIIQLLHLFLNPLCQRIILRSGSGSRISSVPCHHADGYLFPFFRSFCSDCSRRFRAGVSRLSRSSACGAGACVFSAASCCRQSHCSGKGNCQCLPENTFSLHSYSSILNLLMLPFIKNIQVFTGYRLTQTIPLSLLQLQS